MVVKTILQICSMYPWLFQLPILSKSQEIPSCEGNKCGEYRSRTDDLLRARQAL